MKKATNAERYAYLTSLADRNATLFDQLVMYILPVISIAIWFTKPERVTAKLLIEAARTIADQVVMDIRDEDSLFPPQSETFKRELQAAAGIAQLIFDAGLATVDRPADVRSRLLKQGSESTILSEINRTSFNFFVGNDRISQGVFPPNDVVSDVFVTPASAPTKAA